MFDFGNLETSQFSPFLNISRYFENYLKKNIVTKNYCGRRDLAASLHKGRNRELRILRCIISSNNVISSDIFSSSIVILISKIYTQERFLVLLETDATSSITHRLFFAFSATWKTLAPEKNALFPPPFFLRIQILLGRMKANFYRIQFEMLETDLGSAFCRDVLSLPIYYFSHTGAVIHKEWDFRDDCT